MLTKEITIKVWRDDKDDPEDVQVVLRKWSPLKLLTLIGDIGEVGQLLGDDFSLDGTMTAPRVAHLIQALGDKAIRKAAGLIAASTLKPRNLSAEDVLAWDLDDFVSTLAEILDMNFSEGTRKNFARLRIAVAPFRAREAPEGKIVELPEKRKRSTNSAEPAPAP